MIWIDFDDIWQKYSEGSRIEFACFIFHVGLRLLVMTLSSLKPHAENRLTRALHAVRFSQLLSAPFLVALETQNFVNNLRN